MTIHHPTRMTLQRWRGKSPLTIESIEDCHRRRAGCCRSEERHQPNLQNLQNPFLPIEAACAAAPSLTMTQLLRRICRALHRRPDADLRRRVKGIAILQIRQDANEKIRKSGISLRRQRFVHSGLMVPRSQVPPTRHSIRSDPDALRRPSALSDLLVTSVTACSRGQSGCDASPRRLPLLTHLPARTVLLPLRNDLSRLFATEPP
jgi:hypothetical protein